LNPHDYDYSARLARVAWSYGIKQACILQQGSYSILQQGSYSILQQGSYRGPEVDLFLAEWGALGGSLTGDVIVFEDVNRGVLVSADTQIAAAVTSGTQVSEVVGSYSMELCTPSTRLRLPS
jgi:hypothetical protein